MTSLDNVNNLITNSLKIHTINDVCALDIDGELIMEFKYNFEPIRKSFVELIRNGYNIVISLDHSELSERIIKDYCRLLQHKLSMYFNANPDLMAIFGDVQRGKIDFVLNAIREINGARSDPIGEVYLLNELSANDAFTIRPEHISINDSYELVFATYSYRYPIIFRTGYILAIDC